jgi:hypothetical protein
MPVPAFQIEYVPYSRRAFSMTRQFDGFTPEWIVLLDDRMNPPPAAQPPVDDGRDVAVAVLDGEKAE